MITKCAISVERVHIFHRTKQNFPLVWQKIICIAPLLSDSFCEMLIYLLRYNYQTSKLSDRHLNKLGIFSKYSTWPWAKQLNNIINHTASCIRLLNKQSQRVINNNEMRVVVSISMFWLLLFLKVKKKTVENF